MENMCYVGYAGDEGLGVAPLVAAGVEKATPLVKSVVKSVTGVFAKYDKDKDANRRATNARAYDLARATHEVMATRFLQGRSGKYGTLQVGPLTGITAGGLIGGWASPPAREDAEQKYDALKADGYDQPTVAQRAAQTVSAVQPQQLGLGLLAGLVVLGMVMSGGPHSARRYRRNPARRRTRR